MIFYLIRVLCDPQKSLDRRWNLTSLPLANTTKSRFTIFLRIRHVNRLLFICLLFGRSSMVQNIQVTICQSSFAHRIITNLFNLTISFKDKNNKNERLYLLNEKFLLPDGRVFRPLFLEKPHESVTVYSEKHQTISLVRHSVSDEDHVRPIASLMSKRTREKTM